MDNWFGLPLAQPAWTARAVSRRYKLEILPDRCGWVQDMPYWWNSSLDPMPLMELAEKHTITDLDGAQNRWVRLTVPGLPLVMFANARQSHGYVYMAIVHERECPRLSALNLDQLTAGLLVADGSLQADSTGFWLKKPNFEVLFAPVTQEQKWRLEAENLRSTDIFFFDNQHYWDKGLWLAK